MFGLGSRPARVRLQLLIKPAPPVEKIEVTEVVPSLSFTESQVDEPDSTDDDFDDDSEVDNEDDLMMRTDVYDGPIGEDADVGKVVLAELLEHMSVRAEVLIRRSKSDDDDEENPPWILDVTGPGDLNVLIGRRGETLASLQYITRLITSRELQRRANIIVDVDGYKFRRTSKLHDLARRMAEQAIGESRVVTLEPMPPYERRIVHLALRGREDVYTESVGEGSSRKVTIIPK
jgi:spoIIIJ-associated protein